MSAGAKQDGNRKPGTFVKGDPRINRAGGPRGKKQPNTLLQDMRAVYDQDESKDRGPAQKALRRMFNENIDKFLARLGRLEQASQTKEEKAPETTEEVDEGTERALALCDQILADIEAKEAQENAAFAARPDAAAVGASLQRKLSQALGREAKLKEEIANLRRAT